MTGRKAKVTPYGRTILDPSEMNMELFSKSLESYG